MRQKQLITVLVVVAATAGFFAENWTSRAESPPGKPAISKKAPARQRADGEEREKSLLAQFMRAKLTASSDVLEGLVTEDFELIGKGAKNLKKLSSAEKWRVSNDAMFRQHSAEFRSSVDSLEKAAEKKQIDAAALAWTNTTLNCIECHRWVRAMLIARNEN